MTSLGKGPDASMGCTETPWWDTIPCLSPRSLSWVGTGTAMVVLSHAEGEQRSGSAGMHIRTLWEQRELGMGPHA